MHLRLPIVLHAIGGLVVLGVFPAAFAASEMPTPAITIYTNLTVIDGTGAPAASGMALVVEGEYIKAVLSMGSLATAPVPGATVVDLTGKFALPGLIDTHQHLGTTPNRPAAEAQLSRMLYGGVTAVRDMAGDARFLADLARAARIAAIPAPEIYFSALMAGPGFFQDPRTHSSALGAEPGHVPWLQAITAETDMAAAVTLARGTGASGIKIYADLPATEVRRIVTEARRQGFPVWGHAAIFPARPGDGIAAGLDSISHAYMFAYEFDDPAKQDGTYKNRTSLSVLHSRLDADTTVLPALFAEMKQRGTILDATVHTMFEADAKQAPEKPKRGPLGARLTHAAHQAGVTISAGTDFTPAGTDTYPALQTEIESLVRDAGMSPAEVIRAATSIAARTFKADAVMGTLTPGKLANLVVVARNPLADITALREVVLTVKRGHAYPRTDYRQPDAKILDEDY